MADGIKRVLSSMPRQICSIAYDLVCKHFFFIGFAINRVIILRSTQKREPEYC